jgi:hypothetical protein
LLETYLQHSKSGVVFNVTEGGEKAIKFGSTDVTETDIGTTRMTYSKNAQGAKNKTGRGY